MKRALLIIVLLAITACESYKPPRQYNFNREKVYNKTYDEVWTRVVTYFSNYGVPIKTIDKSSGLIASDFNLSAAGFSNIMDCGTPAQDLNIYKFENQTGNFNVQVIKISEKQTKVKIVTFFKTLYVRYTNNNGYWVRTGSELINCNSTGNFETGFFNEIGR